MTAGRWLALGGVAFAALVIAAVVVALVLPPKEATYPEGSPEAAVQAYLRAMASGEYETALGMLSKGTHEYTCTVNDLLIQRQGAEQVRDARVEIKDVRLREMTATLTLVIRHNGASRTPPFNDNGYTEEQVISLVQEEGAWRLGDGAFGRPPWPLNYCITRAPPLAPARGGGA